MWKVHASRVSWIALVFVLMFAFDALVEMGWFARMPVVMGIVSVLAGLALSRRQETAAMKKNKPKV